MVHLPREVKEYFPYPSFRPKQDEVIKIMYESVKERKIAIIEAMSGFGKTVAILSALLPIAKKESLKILYVARTHKEHERVIEEARNISKKHNVSAIALRGRREMCLLEKIRSIKDYHICLDACERLRKSGLCPYYNTFISDFNSLFQKFKKPKFFYPLSARDLLEIGLTHKVCAYELAKALLRDAEIIACSYMYLFNKNIFRKFMAYLGTSLDNIILVLDEAHNIPELATDSMSDTISVNIIKSALDECIKELSSTALTSFLKSLLRSIIKFREVSNSYESIIPKELIERIALNVVHLHIEDIVYLMRDASELVKEKLIRKGKIPHSYLYRLSRFLETWNYALYNDHLICVLHANPKDFTISVLALDPSPLISVLLENCYSAILTSATLEPLHAFRDIIGVQNRECILKSVQVVPPREKLLVLGVKGVTTDFKHRSLSMYSKIVSKISEVLEVVPGNVGIFAASYEVLEGLLKAGLDKISTDLEKPLFIERPSATSLQNDELVRNFKSYANKGGAVLLGVQGGRNAEGEDFPGKEMIVSIIVGIPYAKPSPIIKERINYYEGKFPGRGKLYSYILPAIRKSLQAAGRPFRGIEEKSAIVFLDFRFLQKPCKKLLPLWIRKRLKVIPDEEGTLAKELLLFFG